MAKKERRQTQRQLDNAKAFRIRNKLRHGKGVDDDDRSWLAAYEISLGKRATPAEPIATAATDSVRSSTDEDISALPSETPPAPSVDEPFSMPPPVAGALPAPPRVNVRAEGEASSGDWREKYREKGGGDGREQTCTLVAGYWVGALESMAQALRAAKIDPIIEPRSLAPAIVLTLDELLPDTVAVTPKMVAVGGSSALLAQRFFRRDEIRKAQEVAKARAKHDEWKAGVREEKERVETAPQADAVSEPAPATPVNGTPAADPDIARPKASGAVFDPHGLI